MATTLLPLRLRRKVRSGYRWLRSRLLHGAVILVYHRIAELTSDPQLLQVAPEHFAEHLGILRKTCRPIRLQELCKALQGGDVPDRAVVVTFDDGYADNLCCAKPLLEEQGIPATVFVTTGYIGGEREFWWDELERVLLLPGTLPETLRLSIDGSAHEWKLGGKAQYSEEDFGRYRQWNVLEQDDPTPRQGLYRSLCKLLRPLPYGRRQEVPGKLSTWAGAGASARRTHRILSSDEVSQLAEGDLVEVGAHSMTHPMLPRLTMAEQREEILNSRKRLEDICGRRVVSFAYPYGQASKKTRELVQEAGFTSGCSTIAGTTTRFSDLFWLPRLLVRDWDGERFGSELRRAFEG